MSRTTATRAVSWAASIFGLLVGSVSAQGGDARTYGVGCPGGRPDLSGWAPHPGLGNLSVFGFNRVPNAPVAASLGGRRDLPLDFLTLAGCRLYTDLLTVTPATADAGGRVSVSWPVPSDPSLAGGTVYSQVIGLRDSRVSPIGLTTSAGVALRIGPVVTNRGLTTTGDPRTPNGAQWAYRDIDAGVPFDIIGRLWIPRTPQPASGYPAVVISHGGGGGVNGYSTAMAKEMVQWGLVCIAVNYTHTSQKLGSPGGRWENGGHLPNVQRALKCLDILRGLGSVDMTRVAAHGNSNGGLLTTTLVAAAPNRFRAASHTAAGMDDTRSPQYPSTATAQRVSTPYLVQHGDRDTSVPIQLDRDFVSVLSANTVPHRFVVWPGIGHELGNGNSPVLQQMLLNVRLWFRQHGVL